MILTKNNWIFSIKQIKKQNIRKNDGKLPKSLMTTSLYHGQVNTWIPLYLINIISGLIISSNWSAFQS